MNHNPASDHSRDLTARLFQLKEELKKLKPMLNKVWDEVLRSEVSKYPVFVVYQEDHIGIGLPVYQKVGLAKKWNINISTLEEFYVKGLIRKEKVDEFRRVYKDPEGWFALLVLSSLGAQIIFLPRYGVDDN